MRLENKVALVTGAGSGIGRAIVEQFVKEGARVVASDIREDRLQEVAGALNAGDALLTIRGDVSNRDDIAHTMDSLMETYGRLDIVVNNAGIYGPIGPTEEVDLAEWTQAWSVNVTGTLLVCQHAVRVMRPQRAGKIINISGGGATNPMPRFAAYAATKAAVVRLTETLAEEFRADRIDVNAIAPGALRTRLTAQVLAAGPAKAGAEFFAKNKKWSDEGAVDPKLGAALCVYLASSESDGITGKLISAQWDPWQDPARFRALATGDVYTLRRIVPEDRPKQS